jgi:hypothetical protein
MKTSELTGAALDWAVAKCEDASLDTLESYVDGMREADDGNYSTNWAQGGPLVEREKIGVGYTTEGGATWLAAKTDDPFYISGPTPLIAAMRCYVASKMGDTVDIPEELTP